MKLQPTISASLFIRHNVHVTVLFLIVVFPSGLLMCSPTSLILLLQLSSQVWIHIPHRSHVFIVAVNMRNLISEDLFVVSNLLDALVVALVSLVAVPVACFLPPFPLAIVGG